MIRIPGRIPVFIHPLFWLLAGLIGWMNSFNLMGTLIWIGIIFFSVLIHEFGHALAALFFGKNPRIDLIALGGLTSYEPGNLSYGKQFLIVFNGPLFGFFLFLGSWWILSLGLITNPTIAGILVITKLVNLFWTIINLLPVLPLDGGQLLRIGLEAAFGIRGFKIALFIGMIVSIGIALVAFSFQFFLPGVLFFLFAFQSYEGWKRAKNLSNEDRDEGRKEKLYQAETTLKEGRKEEAKQLFYEIKNSSKEGVLHNTANQYLAFIEFEEGNQHQAYELLLESKKDLNNEALCLLHYLAALEKNYEVVVELSTPCYEFSPSQDLALRNAKAYAQLGQPTPAGGWLQTAWKFGSLDLEKTLSSEEFAKVKENPKFLEFIEKMN